MATPTETFELVIAGGGLTAARAVKAYRAAGGEGRVALIAREDTLPYHRPPLSKRFLRGETDETPHVEDEAFYREHDVDVRLSTSVDGVDASARIVTAGGASIGYAKLLLATGSTPRRLSAPGAELPGVHTLRTIHDSAAIRAAARDARRAVVVGAGFIGMEVAASLRQLGVEVTLIHVGSGLFDQFGSERLSADLVALYRERGIELLLEEEVASFAGDGRLAAVETKGGRRVDADLAVVGIGVVPNVAFLEHSGLELENGVVVDERLAASAEGVWAAGDIANFHDPLFDRRRRIEHWSNANYQGELVGRILAGEDARYDTVSSFFSEIFGTTLKVFGDLTRADETRAEGSLAGGLVVGYGEGGRLVGALAVGQSEEAEARLKEQIAARGRLADLVFQEH
jgi:NADPH-dependent 2,4-dienoyl-CoA reductase/sulfur reductase-like enzyme